MKEEKIWLLGISEILLVERTVYRKLARLLQSLTKLASLLQQAQKSYCATLTPGVARGIAPTVLGYSNSRPRPTVKNIRHSLRA